MKTVRPRKIADELKCLHLVFFGPQIESEPRHELNQPFQNLQIHSTEFGLRDYRGC